MSSNSRLNNIKEKGSFNSNEPFSFITIKEDFIHFVWEMKKFNMIDLCSTTNEKIELLHLGMKNVNSGPDFFNAKLRVAKQLWAGNVEIHVKSSDWYLHNHQDDQRYNNVILHVVWEDDVPVFDKNNQRIPTLELKNRVAFNLLQKYQMLKTNTHWIYCEKNIKQISSFTIEKFKERLFIERLEYKAKKIQALLEANQNNWEATLYHLLLCNFGLKVNFDAFEQIALHTPFTVVRKVRSNLKYLESLFFGQANLLDSNEQYAVALNKEYQYIKHKTKIHTPLLKAQFFKLRPASFPTIRLSQLANLIHDNENLFLKLMHAKHPGEFYKLLKCKASIYWDTHYVFGKESSKRIKYVTRSFIELLVVNLIIPLKFVYSKKMGIDTIEEIFDIAIHFQPENNTIINQFKSLGFVVNSSLDSQAFLELKNSYCNKQKCLKCSIGNELLNGK